MKARAAWQAVKFIGKAVISRSHPLLAHLIVTRRCNLSCTYCNEYDKVSAPVPTKVLMERIDHLARLETGAITCTGGEPLLHPGIDEIIAHVRRQGIIATLITNGYLLTQNMIERLNRAGLQELQISIDNVYPDQVSKKSLKVLDRKLALLAELAAFKVNINTVLGVSEERTVDAVDITARAAHYGFSSSVGLLHDGSGRLKPLSGKQFMVYEKICRMSRSLVQTFNRHIFQENLIHGKANLWKCRAGARYLYICEDGRVHWCSQQRGYPNILLSEYTCTDIAREFDTRKDCSDFCTVSCVQQMSFVDRWRSRQTLPDPHSAAGDEALPPEIGVSLPVGKEALSG